MTALDQAFERLGQIREHLTELQWLAADLDDNTLSRTITDHIRANTKALTRTTQLRQHHATTTEAPARDLAVT